MKNAKLFVAIGAAYNTDKPLFQEDNAWSVIRHDSITSKRPSGFYGKSVMNGTHKVVGTDIQIEVYSKTHCHNQGQHMYAATFPDGERLYALGSN